jgi:thiol-disulfide isomerase/thioredoxin
MMGLAKMYRRLALIALFAATTLAAQDIVRDVRAAIAQNDYKTGESLIEKFKTANGVTPEMIEAVSWLGRGALAAKQFDAAYGYAEQARELALAELKRRKLDAEPHLPIALGASIEVQAHVMAAKGDGGEAVAFLRRELAAYRATSMRTRIQKNIHLLSLEGKPAPALEVKNWLGPKPPSLASLKGKPVLLFFWAHWCSTCKRQAPDLMKVAAEYAPQGLVVVGPTQHYGYTTEGSTASPEQETAHIDSVRNQFYAGLASMPVPISEENMKNYGVSTTPTLVFVDPKGIVRTYHPGAMSHAELTAGIKRIMAD